MYVLEDGGHPCSDPVGPVADGKPAHHQREGRAAEVRADQVGKVVLQVLAVERELVSLIGQFPQPQDRWESAQDRGEHVPDRFGQVPSELEAPAMVPSTMTSRGGKQD